MWRAPALTLPLGVLRGWLGAGWAGLSRGHGCGECVPSCDTIRGMKLEQERVLLGTELRPSVGGRSRPSLARLPPLLPPTPPRGSLPLQLPADCIEMPEPPRRPLEPQPLNMLSRANLFLCLLMELHKASRG